jgi:hypothetical protein
MELTAGLRLLPIDADETEEPRPVRHDVVVPDDTRGAHESGGM